MGKKIVIVGGVAGGASVAARSRRLDESNEIVMFERGPHVSFSNCCLPYHLSGKVEDHEDLVLMKPEQFFNQYRIDARVFTEVVFIDRENKEVTVRNVVTGKEYKESYDKLILSPGAKPIVPPIPGINNADIFTVRNVVDIAKLNTFIKEKKYFFSFIKVLSLAISTTFLTVKMSALFMPGIGGTIGLAPGDKINLS